MHELHSTTCQRRAVSRRIFVRHLAAAAATAPLPWIVPRTALSAPGRPGANDRVDVALLGMGARGSQMVDNLPETGRVVAVADPNRKKAEENTQRKGGEWTVYNDVRRLLDKEKIDGVVCCNTDHNHIHTAILACQAGADLYVEKPFCHTIAEGRALVDLAKRDGRVLQAGTQSRSIPLNQLLLCGIRDGKYGKLRAVICRSHRIAGPTPRLAAEPMPGGMNWDAWLGPAPQLPYAQQLLQRWLQYRDFSQWTNGGWGAHAYDMIQNALGAEDTGPVAIWPTERQSHFGDQPGVLNTKLRMKYASGHEIRLELDRGTGPDVGAIFVCEDAKIEINRNTFKSNPPDLIKELPPDPDARQEVSWTPTRLGWMGRCHVRNWLECIKSRQRPHAYGELAQRAGTLCCLTTIARLTNRPLKWDSKNERFIDDEAANAMVHPPRRQGYALPSIG
jgi:nicotinamidase-related amidase